MGTCALLTYGSTPTDAEWLGITAALLTVFGCSNPLVRVGDATHTTFTAWTPGPLEPSRLLSVIFRTMAPWPVTVTLQEFRTPAQHTGLTADVLSDLNAQAHSTPQTDF